MARPKASWAGLTFKAQWCQMVTPQSVQGHTGLTHHFFIFDIRAVWRGLDQYGPERFGRLILLQSENAGLKGLICRADPHHQSQ